MLLFLLIITPPRIISIEHLIVLLVFLFHSDSEIFILSEAIPICKIGMLINFMSNDERVPLFIIDQFIQVSHEIEENPTFLLLLLEMMKIEHYVVFRVQEIYHLTYHILEEHNFMIKILHSLFLLFIEVIHLISLKIGVRWECGGVGGAMCTL